MKNPPSLDQLIAALKVLPGVGPKSAQRMAFHLLQRDKAGADKLARALDRALLNLRHCERCHTFSETPLCNVCADDKRRQEVLCVVEMPAERSQDIDSLDDFERCEAALEAAHGQ